MATWPFFLRYRTTTLVPPGAGRDVFMVWALNAPGRERSIFIYLQNALTSTRTACTCMQGGDFSPFFWDIPIAAICGRDRGYACIPPRFRLQPPYLKGTRKTY